MFLFYILLSLTAGIGAVCAGEDHHYEYAAGLAIASGLLFLATAHLYVHRPPVRPSGPPQRSPE